MTINRALSWQRTAIWIAAVWLGTMSVSAAAQEKAAFPVATPESQGVSAAAVRRLAGEVEEYVKNGTIVGGELLIIKNRKTILHEAYGARDREDKQAMERGTIFNIRSMTKPLTGVAVQMLADEGKLRLDDPVAKYLPGFDNDKSNHLSKADDPRKKRVASLYFGSPGKWTRIWKPGGAPLYPFAWGSQTLYSTPADYARFLALWMDGGTAGGEGLNPGPCPSC